MVNGVLGHPWSNHFSGREPNLCPAPIRDPRCRCVASSCAMRATMHTSAVVLQAKKGKAAPAAAAPAGAPRGRGVG